MNDKVLISGIGGPAGESVTTYFKKKGYPTVGTDVREVEVKPDLFCLVPMALAKDFREATLKIIRQEGIELFVPTVTEELLIISQLKEEIEASGCKVYISPPEGVEITNSKSKTASFLKEHGLRVPVTFDAGTPIGVVLSELGLPFLAKPDFSRGGRGVTLYRTEEEVFNEKRTALIYQEFIPGEEFDVNLFRDLKGDMLAEVVLKKTALKEGIIGNALSVERTTRDDVMEVSKKAAHALGLTGPLNFDVRLDSEGRPVILEINARVGGNVLAAEEVLDALINTWMKEKESYVNV